MLHSEAGEVSTSTAIHFENKIELSAFLQPLRVLRLAQKYAKSVLMMSLIVLTTDATDIHKSVDSMSAKCITVQFEQNIHLFRIFFIV